MHVRLDPLLLRQLGLVTRRQAWEVGVTSDEIDSLLERHLLVRVHRGVFRDPAASRTTEQRGLAGVLAAGAGAVVSHRLAVALIGMRNYRCHLTEITAPGVHRIPNVFSHRSVRPPAQEVVGVVPVTSPARTIIDVGALVGSGTVGRWLETWVSAKVLTLDALDDEMLAVKGHAGVRVVRAALTDRTLVHAAADSPPEAALGLLLERAGLPRLTLHHLVTMQSGTNFELDWSYPELRIAFEMDGYGIHLRSLDAFEHDRFRRNELEIAGWTILNFTKRQVDKRPKTVVGQVERLFASRRAA